MAFLFGSRDKFMLHVRVVEAKNLRAADKNGFSDPYIKVKVGSEKQKTPVFPKTLNPVYNTDFTFTLSGDSDTVLIEVYDRDELSKNDFLGCVSFPVRDIKSAPYQTIAGWFHLTQKQSGLPAWGLVHVILVIDQDRSKDKQDHIAQARKSKFHYALQRLELEQKEEKQTQLSVLVATWNVGNAQPPDGKQLEKWLKPGHDIYVVGCQECKYEPRKGYSSCAQDWESSLVSCLGNEYVLLNGHELMQIRLHVFIRSTLLNKVSAIYASTEATGLAHIHGNKGGVSCSFSYEHTRLCFATAHLAAHQDKTERRNADVAEIFQGIKLGPYHADMLQQFDHVFFCGDLNYRLEYLDIKENTPTEEQFRRYVALIDSGDLEPLWKSDQLTAQIQQQKVLVGFRETRCTFAPTFKVNRHEFPTTYKPQRTPAYCDRILWRSCVSVDADTVTQSEYLAVPEIVTSDHKPVYATFTIPIKHKQHTAIDNTVGSLTATITKLQGSDLRAVDIGGTSDPLVKFHAPFLAKTVRTPPKDKTVCPVWSDLEVPPLPLLINHKGRVAESALIIRVMDKDVARKKTIGCGQLPLSIALNGEPTPFTVQLESGGLPAGSLSGVLQLSWSSHSWQPTPEADL